MSALCIVGKSSKVGSSLRRYFGCEITGFKTVFMVARKVHIRCRHFSFFHNCRRWRGLGTITPTWEFPEISQPPGITKKTLYLDHLTTLPADNSVVQQFEERQPTILLLTRNIYPIVIIYANEEGGTVSSQRYRHLIKQNTIQLVTVTKEGEGLTDKSSGFHVTNSDVLGIPHRVYLPKRAPPQENSSSEVVLAFSLDGTRSDQFSTNQQVQQVFSCMPIGDHGFKDIYLSSRRNRMLVSGITMVFSTAIKQLDDEDLRYKWIKYLPRKDGHLWDGQLKMLYEGIKNEIEALPLINFLIRPHSCKILDIFKLPSLAVSDQDDSSFERIFRVDMSKYQEEFDLDGFKEYSLKTITLMEFIDRVSSDLALPNSRLKSHTTTGHGHTIVTNLLALPFEQKWEVESRHARRINSIPRELLSTLISITQNASRIAFFRHLRTEGLSVAQIQKLIFEQYSAVTWSSSWARNAILSLELSTERLKFLDLTRNAPSVSSGRYERTTIHTDGKYWRAPLSQDIYICRNNLYIAMNLLKLVKMGHIESKDDKFAGLDVDFVSSSYSSNVKLHEEDTWVDWLQVTSKPRTRLPPPPLVNDNVLTIFFRHIMEHNKELLQSPLYYRSETGKAIEWRDTISKEIARCLVPTGDGLVGLRDTYLPIPDFIQAVSRFNQNVGSFPFLRLRKTLSPRELSPWRFLSDYFGVGDSKNIFLCAHILAHIAEVNKQGTYDQSSRRAILGLYQIPQKDLDTVVAREQGQDYVWSASNLTLRQHRFNSKSFRHEYGFTPLIYLPVNGSGRDRWKDIDHCCWECHMNMRSVSGLRSHFLSVLKDENKISKAMAHHIILRTSFLYRIATPFGNPKADDSELLCQLPKRFEVYKVPLTAAELYLAEGMCFNDGTQDAVRIYIPANTNHHNFCLLFFHPITLLKCMMDGNCLALEATENGMVIPLTTGILNTEPSPTALLLDMGKTVESNILTDVVPSSGLVEPGYQIEVMGTQLSGKDYCHPASDPVTLSPNRTGHGTASVLHREKRTETPAQAASTSLVRKVPSGHLDSKKLRTVTPSTIQSDKNPAITKAVEPSIVLGSTPVSQLPTNNSANSCSSSYCESSESIGTSPQQSSWTWSVPPSLTLPTDHSRLCSFQGGPVFSQKISPQPVKQNAVTLDSLKYPILLERVIGAARIAGLPTKSFDMTEMTQPLAGMDTGNPRDDYLGGFEGTDRRKRMGAAGELYVSQTPAYRKHVITPAQDI
ncbi:hypothetical protein GGS21DRAFT_390111 [Xylaria nigripes]|nr:hypothetical protein GGS21DRAFT_390111 [Xylaria nigripes]